MFYGKKRTALVWCYCLAVCVSVCAELIIHAPGLSKPLHFVHADALFGPHPYGTSIKGRLYHAGSGCYQSETDKASLKALLGENYILIFDRGTCDYIRKSRGAQRAGAKAVILAGTNADALVFMTQQAEAEDGVEAITIPSIFISLHANNEIKTVLTRSHNKAQATIDWRHKNRKRQVNWELWSSTFDPKYAEYHTQISFDSLQTIATELSDTGIVTFSPKFFIVPGLWVEGTSTIYCRNTYVKLLVYDSHSVHFY
jgi:hypothetical protein